MATIVFDFDGVIAKYDKWQGEDVFGDPILSTIYVMNLLKNRGHKILIWTTRRKTSALINWLDSYNVPYDSINDNSHNPPGTSQKPIFDIFIDDRAITFNEGMNLIKVIENFLCKKGKIE